MSDEYSLHLSETPGQNAPVSQEQDSPVVQSADGHELKSWKSYWFFKAIDINKDIVLFKNTIEMLQLDENQIIAVLQENPSKQLTDLLYTVQGFINKAKSMLHDSTKKYNKAKEQYKMIVMDHYTLYKK